MVTGKLPLYQGTDVANHSPRQGHAGLWFDKFCNQWDPNWSMSGGDNRKQAWIDQVTGSWPQDDNMLKEMVRRRGDMIQGMGGKTINFKTVAPFVTGMGRENPIENGFAWHHSLGMPYLPGTSLKGVVRSWMEHWLDPVPGTDVIQRIFGAQGQDEHESQAGNIIFFDALPTGKVQLQADVMTPHYSEYYQAQKLPGDWLSPNPIPFLTVNTDAVFQFCIAARCRQDAPINQDLETMADTWLEGALEWLGAGAKTAVGYGRFTKA